MVFPAKLKKITIIPIHKSGDASFMHNFSPISILTDISKVFKQLLYILVCLYLSENKNLDDDNYGYRENLSTTDALLHQTQYLFDSIGSGNPVFSLILDFKKAFDSADNNVLRSKLCLNCFRGLPYDLLKVVFDWLLLTCRNKK